MFGIFRRQARTRPDHRAVLLSNSRDTRQWYERKSSLEQLFFALRCEAQWGEALEVFGSRAGFAKASMVEQTDYLRTLVEIGNNYIDQGDEVAGRAVHLISAYLCGIATQDDELQSELRMILSDTGANIADPSSQQAYAK